jgi:hypothetical protein
MLKFIQNIGDYFSSNYFDEDFTRKVLNKTGYGAEDIREFNKRISPLKDRYFRFKQLFTEGKLRVKDKIAESHRFHTLILNALGYDGTLTHYDNFFHLSEQEVIPVRHILHRGDQPHLMIMEMQALIKEDDTDPDGLFEQRYNVETEEQTNPPQRYHRSQWDEVFKVPAHLKISPVIINEAISELFLLEQHHRPKYILLLAGNVIFLLEQEKWFRGSYLQIDLEELFSEATASRQANYYALFYFLLGKETLAPESNIVLLDQLDEDSHKSAYEVTKDLKEGIIHAVEALANEALYYKKEKLHQNFDETDDVFEQEVKDDCLKIIYRLLFIFYAESREDLDILPSNDAVYQRGYSLEMLRDLEQVQLYSESSLNGYFFHESLARLFQVLSSGYREKENGNNKSFKVRHIDSPLFNDDALKQLKGVRFRNRVWQDIISRLSLSKQQKGKARGRISYANLGINQLGSVYESLLAYRGFYAEQDYIEVHKANEPKDGTYLVPRSRRDDFEENEILKDGDGQAAIIKRGTFVYRLSGRDRQKSASYYTPEVLTQCTVKYTLKPILEKLDKGEMKAVELLELKLLEPAMGAAAFHNEMINQLADAYLSYRQEELKKAGRTAWKVPPDKYREELQKVKAYIATNNVYGVDLNPTAIELGKLSLWLNVIHKDMETPFFSNRLAVGNAVVGAWLKVYKEKELLEEYITIKDAKGKPKRVLVKKEWWNTAPRQLSFSPTYDYTKIKHGRKQDEIYHFLLPDPNMVASAGIKLLKEENEKEVRAVTNWRKEWIAPVKKSEADLLKKICVAIDQLLVEYYRFQRTINQQTASRQSIFGAQKNAEQREMTMRSYDEKERLADQRNRHNAPYFKLKMVMDYWCSLWFWDVREARELPERQQFWQDVAGILEMDVTQIADDNEDDVVIEEKVKDTGSDKNTSNPGNAIQVEFLFEEAVVEYSRRKDLFDNNQRLVIVSQLARQYHFFHSQLEFLEVFWERGGFDLIAGNPPWIKIEFLEKRVLSEAAPELEMRDIAASEVTKRRIALFAENQYLKRLFIDEFIEIESLTTFLNSGSNYPLLVGQQTDLYKCVLSNSFSILNNYGVIGLIHPESVYEDSNGGSLRKEIYNRLMYHFHFRNEFKLFKEIGHTRQYSVNIYGPNSSQVSFTSMHNLFHPSSIEASIVHDGTGISGGLKVKNPIAEKYDWNISPHKERVIIFTLNELATIARFLNVALKDVPLISIHSYPLLKILEKVSSYQQRVHNIKSYITEGWHEPNDVKKGFLVDISTNTRRPDINAYELIYTSPNLHILNPLYKTPKKKSSSHHDYENIDLNKIDSRYLPNVEFVPGVDEPTFKSKFTTNDSETYWIDGYKIAYNKMLDPGVERTLQPAIIPPKSTHTQSIISLHTSDTSALIGLAGLSSSILIDFYIKILKKANLSSGTIENLPLIKTGDVFDKIRNRVLRLTCLNEYYKELWENNFSESIYDDSWTKILKCHEKLGDVTSFWSSKTPLRAYISRRQALIEIDVLASFVFGLELSDLITVYNTYFPITQAYEDSTYFDQKGNIVFTTNSQGLRGVGVDKKTWEIIKDKGEGETHSHSIIKSDLYNGDTITYYAPFYKCDRVEDYKLAWQHFEKIFSKEE